MVSKNLFNFKLERWGAGIKTKLLIRISCVAQCTRHWWWIVWASTRHHGAGAVAAKLDIRRSSPILVHQVQELPLNSSNLFLGWRFRLLYLFQPLCQCFGDIQSFLRCTAFISLLLRLLNYSNAVFMSWNPRFTFRVRVQNHIVEHLPVRGPFTNNVSRNQQFLPPPPSFKQKMTSSQPSSSPKSTLNIKTWLLRT